MKWPLSFISQENFYTHVKKTIDQYGESLEPFNILRFNSNIVDPIKLIFDKNIYGLNWDGIINNEILRQRDKTNNNIIGYFHQHIFKYINMCIVPDEGWDVIFEKKTGINITNNDIVHKVMLK